MALRRRARPRDAAARRGERSSRASQMLELDRIAEEHIAAKGGIPTSKGYKGFPAALCASRRTRWSCTGFRATISAPGGRPHLGRSRRDTRRHSSPISAVTPAGGRDHGRGSAAPRRRARRRSPRESPRRRPSNRLSDISHAIQIVVEEAGFSVVRSLVGHGVGRSVPRGSADPELRPAGRGPLLRDGMTLAIEPMITAEGPRSTSHDDEWSISSLDESLAAHFEHTVAVTADGPWFSRRPEPLCYDD